MSKIILKKNGTDYLFGFIPIHYPADRVYLDGDTTKSVQDNMARKSDLTNLLLAVYPVGSIYMSVNNVDPGTLFGGTWVAWGSGKVPVGVDANDTDFDTVEETGGAKSVTLTSAQSGVPAHNHSVGAHSHGLNEHTHSIPALSGTAASNGGHTHNLYKQIDNYSGSQLHIKEDSSSGTVIFYNTDNSKKTLSDGSHTHSVTTNASTSGKASGSTANSTAFNSGNNTAANASQAHTNLQPYITCYMWKRTA